ncbi:MAG: DUF58 domain-containing protein [Pseudobutyrivibrio sp.]|nr:DUF58 domain-containing protein [Pseudobutyrivibrio sp.]
MRISIHFKNFAIYIVMLIISIVFASFFGGPVAFVWLYAMVLLIPVSILYIALNYKFLSLYQEIEIHKVSKGEIHKYRILLENSGILPIHNMALSTYSDRCDLLEITDGQLISLDVKEKIELLSNISCKYAGAYDVGAKSLTFTDPFNIFSVDLNVLYTFKAVVRPKITNIANAALDFENLVNNSGFKSIKQVEDIPGNDMRAYQAGDSLSSINWKVSAKFSELMVRLPNPMEKRSVTLIMDAANWQDSKQNLDYLKMRDFFLEFVVSAAWNFGQQSVPLEIIYPSGDIKISTVNSYESFMEFYNEIADGVFYRSDAVKKELQSLIQEKSVDYDQNTCILIKEDSRDKKDFCSIIG